MKTLLLAPLLALLTAVPVLAQAQVQDLETPLSQYREAVAAMDVAALEAEADAWQTSIEDTGAQIKVLDEQIAEAGGDAKTELEASRTELVATRDKQIARMQAVVSALGDHDVDVSAYQVFLTEASGRFDIQNLSTGMAVGLLQRWYDRGKAFLVDEGPSLLGNLIAFVVVLLIFKWLAKLAGGLLGRTIKASRLELSELLHSFFVGTARKLVFFIGILVALPFIGVDIGPFLAGVGVVGFVVGFALQDTLANFAAGIMILLYRPYDVGNYVTAGGISGTVNAMSLVSTTFLTPDNQRVVVPNSAIWGGTITNVTAMPTRRLDLTVGVSYSDDLDKVEGVLKGIIEGHDKVLKEPAPAVKVKNLGDSSVDFAVRPWVKTGDYWDVFFDLNKTIKQRLDSEGISIPFPQRDVHLFQEGGREQPA